MAIIIELTQLSPTMNEGTFVKWLKEQGDAVSPGDILAEVETDKAVMEMEAYDDGILLLRLAKDGERLPVGAPIAILGDVGEDFAELQSEAERRRKELLSGGAGAAAGEATVAAAPVAAEVATAATKPAESPSEPSPPPSRSESKSNTKPKAPVVENRPTGRILASPAARKLARERGIELSRLHGSGPGGRVVRADVMTAMRGGSDDQGPQPQQRDDERVEISNMREVIADRLSHSKRELPHFYLTIEIDAEPLSNLREQLNADFAAIADGEEKPTRISVNDLIIKAAALALQRHPIVNSSWRGDHILQHGRIDIGVAVALPVGLITPYIRRADMLTLTAIAARNRDLVRRARERKLRPEEYSDGTFTISNLGMMGIDHFTAIINEPEAAILAVGKVVEKAVVRDGQLLAGKTMQMTLSCDHRVVDGASGAAFMQTLQQLLEHPGLLLAL